MSSPGVVAQDDWLRVRERGSGVLLHAYARLSRAIGRGPSRVLLHAITAYYLLFAPRARRHSRDYLRRALGRPPTLADVYRHFSCFATTIHDRVFLAAGAIDAFDVEVQGAECLAAARATGQGALLMGAHLGSFEMVGAVGERHAGAPVAMAMYEENARKMRAMMGALRSQAAPEVVPLGRVSSLLRIRDLLDAGGFVGVLADRTRGDEPVQRVRLLDADASLPLGPFRAAAMLRRRVIFMAGVHEGGRRYRVLFEPLADFTTVEAGGRDAAIAAAVEAYAARLTALCRAAPFNWFNFYDVWR